MSTRQELISVVRERYAQATGVERRRILDEFVSVTGYHRKHAIRLLRGSLQACGGGPGEPRRIYREAERAALIVLWEAADRICGKRLKAALPTLVEAMERHGHLCLEPAVRERLLAMSAATMDRLLADVREQAQGRRRRRTAVNAVRRQVKLRTFQDWGDPAPGWMEADFVAHCGEVAAGSFVHTLTLTDISSGWTECLPIVVRERTLVVEAVRAVQADLPFALQGLDTDNDSAFMNEALLDYCRGAACCRDARDGVGEDLFRSSGSRFMPHKANAARRHHIPRPKRRVTNWAAYNEALRQRGSLTVWFTEDAIAAWKAAPRTTPGGQPHYSDLAVTTALTLRAVFHLALRQAEGLIGSILQLLGLDLPVPDFSTLSRRARSLELPAQPRTTGGAIHLLVDSSGLKLSGPGEWLVEKHGTKKRRSWRKLHIGFDAVSGRIVAAILTDRDVDDASQVDPLLDRIADPVELFLGDGGYDRTNVYTTLEERHPDAKVIIPPRADAVLSATAETEPTQRDGHIQAITDKGRMTWQRDSGYNERARVEGQFARWKQVIGNGLRFHSDQARATEVAVAALVLNRMLDLGRPNSVRVA